MFALSAGTSAKLVHVNVRGEFHGADVIPQGDLRFEVACPNAILDAFDPTLRTCLYKPAPPPHPAAMLPELPGIEPISDTPALRFPELTMPLKWGAEGKGYTLAVDAGSIVLVLRDVTVSGIRLDCLDGGSVGVDFRVSTTAAPDVETLVALAQMVQRNVRLQLTPPADAEAPEFEAFEDPEEVGV
jgi:hypothetical protein